MKQNPRFPDVTPPIDIEKGVCDEKDDKIDRIDEMPRCHFSY